MKRMKNEKCKRNEAKHLVCVGEKNPVAIQRPEEHFYKHLTFPLTTFSLS